MDINHKSFEKSSEKIVQAMMLDVINAGASDIHIEPDLFTLKVRYRIDGVMYDILEIPLDFEESITGHIKERAGMKTGSTCIPQEGQISLPFNEEKNLFIVSCIPVLRGERIVMHFVRHTLLDKGLMGLGFSRGNAGVIEELSKASRGLFVIAGHLSDGRSTTALSIMKSIASSGRRSVSVENVITYVIKEITQITCESVSDLTGTIRDLNPRDFDCILFDEALSSFAMNSACSLAASGKLVIAVSRSRNAATMLNDMVSMGIRRELIASTLLGILAQKLVKVICPDCRKSYNPHPWELRLFESKREFPSGSFSKGIGCDRCRNSGFSGRTPLEQLLVNADELRSTILSGDVSSFLSISDAGGLVDSGREKCLQGITTLQEVLRVLEI